jgi:hypothetical protein
VGLGGSQRAHRRHKLAVLATPAGAAEIMELPRVSPIQGWGNSSLDDRNKDASGR